jgi:hypothetical protein
VRAVMVTLPVPRVTDTRGLDEGCADAGAA